MSLRNVLLTISCIIVGLCLSLYFQTETDVKSMNWDQYKNLQYVDERSHSLQDFNDKIMPFQLQDIIQEIHERNRLAGEKTRVMEIGAGNGRVIMELKKMFPDIEFYVINKEKTHTFYRRESFILTALKFEIFSKLEIDTIDLPYLVFQDLDFGNRIPYDENKFDVVYSQDVLPHFKYKFELLNEVMRVMKPGGVSFHSNVTGINIYSRGIVLELRDALAEFRRRGFDINTLEDRTSIRFRKGNDNSLFPVEPHQPVPEDLSNLPQEMRRPEMGYNITY